MSSLRINRWADRARGSSAWDQFTDTVFIAGRVGDIVTFKNTKQKDDELAPPMYFKLKTGVPTRSRRAGQPRTSVVLEATNAAPKERKLGTRQQVLIEAFAHLASVTNCVEIPLGDLIELAAKKVPPSDDGKKDYRKKNLKRTLSEMRDIFRVSEDWTKVRRMEEVAAEFGILKGAS